MTIMSRPVEPQRLPDGRLRVPIAAYGADGTRGDGVATLSPGDPLYQEWDAWLRLNVDDEPDAQR